eukprot:s349_g25.t1
MELPPCSLEVPCRVAASADPPCLVELPPCCAAVSADLPPCLVELPCCALLVALSAYLQQYLVILPNWVAVLAVLAAAVLAYLLPYLLPCLCVLRIVLVAGLVLAETCMSQQSASNAHLRVAGMAGPMCVGLVGCQGAGC